MNKKLINKIKEKNISYVDLSKKVGVTYLSIWKYCRGFAKPSVNIAIKIAKTLNCSVEDIFNGSYGTFKK